MTEQLFKLKNGGKCVGYERRKRTANGKGMMLQHRRVDGDWKVVQCGRFGYAGWIDHDEMSPFVCKDRHGKDVFDSDEVLYAGQRCSVGLSATHPCWALYPLGDSDAPGLVMFLGKDIELIEDQP